MPLPKRGARKPKGRQADPDDDDDEEEEQPRRKPRGQAPKAEPDDDDEEEAGEAGGDEEEGTNVANAFFDGTEALIRHIVTETLKEMGITPKRGGK